MTPALHRKCSADALVRGRPPRRPCRNDAGITLLEVLIAVTLLSVLSAGMMMAMRIGIMALSHTNSRLMENRRVSGAQRVLEQELQSILPVVAECAGGSAPVAIFSGQANGLTMVTGFSLQEAFRGRPQIIQLFTMPDDKGGMRLVVNEIPYTGPENAGKLCTIGDGVPRFAPPSPGPTTYVLADHLQGVQFQYLHLADKPEDPGLWTANWTDPGWPFGIRVQIAPLDPSPGRLQPVSVTAMILIHRDPMVRYSGE